MNIKARVFTADESSKLELFADNGKILLRLGSRKNPGFIHLYITQAQALMLANRLQKLAKEPVL